MTNRFRTIIDPASLAGHLDDPGWVVFDVRFDLADPAAGRRDYELGHIPGALFADVNTNLAAPPGEGRGRHPLPDAESLARWLGDCGVGPDSQVVAYDASTGTWAARLWWLLRYLGHDDVAVLDGGLARWRAEGLPVETGTPVPRPATSFVGVPRPEMVASADDVLEAVRRRDRIIVDSRAPDRFRGENETIDPVAGRIPGAANRFFGLNATPDGRLRSPEELRADFEPLIGNASPDRAIVYCGSGLTACANLLALEHAGLSGGKLYPGSWSEWCSDPERPVERG